MININGLVNSINGESASFDKLEVRYYDADNNPEEYYYTAQVSEDGRFDHELEEPIHLNLIVKLFIHERNGDYTLVTEDEIYCEATTLDINFDYDENLYSYARNVTVTINGQVTATEGDCISFDKLLVKFFDTYNEGSDYFDSVAVDSNGYFTIEITCPSRGLTAKLLVINRDASETQVSSADYYLDAETLDVNFNYTESNYSYAHPDIAITGLVSPAEEPCNSLDKLKVYYFDGYDPTAAAFASQVVDADGTFSGTISAPSRSVIAKLYVVNADTSETLVESKSFYCPDNDETVNFDYDESLFSYSNSNNNNMGINVKGVVKSTTEEYFNCLDTKKLIVRVFNVGYNSLTQVGTDISVNRDGTFSVNISSEIGSFMVKVYLDDDGDIILVAESPRYCHHDTDLISFEIKESQIGKPVLDKIIGRLNVLGVNDLNTLIGLSDDNINQLSCLSCISVNTLKRLQEALVLWTDFTRVSADESEYAEAATALSNFKLNSERGIAVFFALLRFLSTSLNEVFGFSRQQFENNLKYCAGINEINGVLLSSDYPNWSNLSTLTDLLEGCRNLLLLNSENDGLYYDAKLTHFTDLEYSEKNAMLDLILSRGGLKSIVEIPIGMEDSVKEAKKVAKLGTFIKNHVPFLKHVITQEDGYDLDYWAIAAGTHDPSHPDYWGHLLTGFSPLPTGYTKSEYAALITRSVAAMEPSANMYKHLNGSSITGASQIRSILNDHKEFMIDSNASARYFTTESGKPNSISVESMEDFNRFQRVVRLTKETDGLHVAEALYAYEANDTEGIIRTTNSNGIVNIGRETFTRTLKGLLVSGAGMSSGDAEAKASDVWCDARALNDAAVVTAIHYLRYEKDGAMMPWVINASNGNYPLQSDLGGNYPGNMIPDQQELPNMETLFGSFDTCNCSHCQSVYSPSAYLTDLLNWLRKDVIYPDSPNNSGLDALELQSGKLRRRDIRYLKLSCENANTMLPYIDIVNEILSVNLLPGTSGYAMSGQSMLNNIKPRYEELQTTKTTEEILVQPEHRYTTSEDLLYGKKFPWVLPYNVAFDECISVMGLSGKEYHDVIKDFSNDSLRYNSYNWACALLNLNPEEAGLLTSSTSGNFWLDYWGESSAISTLKAVMEVTGLDIDGVRDIFDSSYVYSTKKVEIKAVDDLCDVESYTFVPVFSTATSSVTIAERFMKFTRLKRKTGLSTWEQDIAIKNISPGSITTTFITQLAACIEFTRMFPVSFADLMIFYGNNAYIDVFSATTYSEYYEGKFRNQLLPAAIRSFFNASLSSNYASNVHALSPEQKQYVSVVLETSVPDLEKIITFLANSSVIGASTTTVPFTTTVLAHIHKYTLFIKLFKLDIDRLARYISLFGNPFTGNVIKNLWDFYTSIGRFGGIGVPFVEFLDITEGTGMYTLANLDKDANRIWDFTEKAFQEAREANKDKDATDSANDTFYTNIVLEALALHFDLVKRDAGALVAEFSSSWLEDFIDDPDGTATERSWVYKASVFLPLYQFFNRIKLLADIFGMSKEAIGNGLKVKAGTLDVQPTNPFYWLGSSFSALPTPAGISSLLWVKGASRHAGLLDIQQVDLSSTPTNDFYILADDYYNNYKTTYGITSNAGINTLYNTRMGAKSAYKLLSLHEFTEIFIRAQALSISSVPGDIVALLDAFEVIYKLTKVFKIKATDAWAWVWKEVASPATTWKPAYVSNALVQTFTPSDFNYTMSADIRRTLNSMFPVFNAWSDVIVPVQNKLRIRMRDAFVAYYIGYRNGVDANRLYAYYLLDTQMAPCMLTSRTVSAISSAQLLIHRAMLGLEQDIYIDETDKQEWEWRKNYRVWEANRKVFLYPENWIEPTLRKNKTMLFKEAEDLLQQDEFSDRNAELAYANYLTGLNEVSNLDVRAVYVEDPAADLANYGSMKYNNTRQETFHVFARNWNPPYYYYHRTFSRGLWTGWEKLDIEINSDHLIPCIFNRRLYLFFPVFVEKIYKQEVATVSGRDVVQKEVKYYEVQMCYTKFDFGKWSQKKVLDGTLFAGPRAGGDFSNDNGAGLGARCGYSGSNFDNETLLNNDLYKSKGFNEYAYVSMKKEDFYFWTQLMPDGDLVIHCRRAHDDKKTVDKYTQFAYEWGFRISAANERVTIVQPIVSEGNTTALRFLSRPSMTIPYHQQMKFGSDKAGLTDQLFFKNTISAASMILDTSLLGVADKYILTYPQQFKHNTAMQPFFFMHPLRNYFFLFNRSVPVLRDMSDRDIITGGA